MNDPCPPDHIHILHQWPSLLDYCGPSVQLICEAQQAKNFMFIGTIRCPKRPVLC